jgi:hypothetical protein
MAFDISRLAEKVDLSGAEWIDELSDIPGLRLKVRSINYKPYQAASGGVYRRNRKLTETDEGILDVLPKSGGPLAEFLLVDWDMANASGPYALTSDGKPVEYSKELATAVLTADDGHGVGQTYRNAVIEAANRVAEKLLSAANDAAGN